MNTIEYSDENMNTEFSEVTDDELNAIDRGKNADETNDKGYVDTGNVDMNDGTNHHSDELEGDDNDATYNGGERSILNNNFILPMVNFLTGSYDHLHY